MAKKKSKSASQAIADAAKALSLTENSKSTEKPPPPKDAEELRLEKLVFGDLSGYQDGLDAALEDDDGENDFERLYSDEEGDAGLELADTKDLSAVDDDELFFLDVNPSAVTTHGEEAGDGNTVTAIGAAEGTLVPTGPLPAWEDSDDERLTISLMSKNRLKKYRETFTDDIVSGTDYIRRLRQQYERVYPTPKWALPPEEPERKRRRRNSDTDASSSASSDSEGGIEGSGNAASALPLSSLLQSTSGYISNSSTTASGKRQLLRPTALDIARLRDVTHQTGPLPSSIQTLSFHPTHPLLMSSGFDHTMRLFHIDGKQNPLVTSLYFKNTPIHTALFHPDGHRVFCSGRRRYFHIWNLETGTTEKVTRVYGHQQELRSMENFKISLDGKYMAIAGSRGLVNILSCTTSQWIGAAKINGQIADFAWYDEHNTACPGLTIGNKHGEIWEYDMTAGKVSSRWLDEGGVATTKIALGGVGDKYIAVGSVQGIVNVYDRSRITKGKISLGETLKPMRTLGQLTTKIDDLAFSPDGQLLCMASQAKQNALRMVHLPTCTVYQNWPTSATPLGRVDSVAFSPGANMFSVGNEAGKIRLWEIRS